MLMHNDITKSLINSYLSNSLYVKEMIEKNHYVEQSYDYMVHHLNYDMNKLFLKNL